MKTSAITRIIIWSIVAVLLTGILCTALVGGNLFGLKFNFPFWGSGMNYADANLYTAGNGSVPASGIKQIEVNWTAGSVAIEPYDGQSVQFEEKNSSTLKEEEKLHYVVHDDKLIIQYRKSRAFWGFGFQAHGGKELTVKVPWSLSGNLKELEVSAVSANTLVWELSAEEISLETVSGRIDAHALTCKELNLETVSGQITAETCTAASVDVTSVSEDILLGGTFETVDTENVSGKTEISSERCPSSVGASSVSGNIKLQIPENEGFTARYETVGGKFTSGFASTAEKGRCVYKNGNADFDFETVSGNIEVTK